MPTYVGQLVDPTGTILLSFLVLCYFVVSIMLVIVAAHSWLRAHRVDTHHVESVLICASVTFRFVVFMVLLLAGGAKIDDQDQILFNTAPSLLFVIACGFMSRCVILPFLSSPKRKKWVSGMNLTLFFTSLIFSMCLLILSFSQFGDEFGRGVALLSVFSIYFAILGVVMSIATFFLWKTVKRLSTSSFDYLLVIIFVACVIGVLGRGLVMVVGTISRPLELSFVDFTSSNSTPYDPFYYYLFFDLFILLLLGWARWMYDRVLLSSSEQSFSLGWEMGGEVTEGEGRGEGEIGEIMGEGKLFVGLPLIQRSELELGEEVGHGSFATVYEGKWLGAPVAVKHFHISFEFVTQHVLEDFAYEMSLLLKARHPNIVQYFGTTSPPFLSIVTEFLDLGSLDEMIESPQKRKIVNFPKTRATILGQVAGGMSYLHDKEVLHRDLTPSNVLLNRKGQAKISDLGLARVKRGSKKMTKVLVGTPSYLAPEVIQSYLYSKKSDIFSFGVLLWRVVCEEQPWGELSSLYDIFESVAEGKRPVTQKTIPEHYKKLIEDCWEHSPKNRPSFLEILDILEIISEKDEKK